ncbi:hypothetical protein BASA62_008471 [Batrachochytrium salamandrivorans]|nr:hypothetical protein BASA62_008471 [Batrachochytrium salamandrivorans]
MRLISFVAISFLAITVSAKLPWTNPYQNLPTSPSTAPRVNSTLTKIKLKLKSEEPDIKNDEKSELEEEYRKARDEVG